ncbi:hypothetical protein EYR36_000708 [Pleurotus pulmonarius]|nr:hypothetical protein EYR36_004675 [Pleurotus pulmonarius]KAF4578900.1 hypothetical protein EYR36_000708 [Pleurotus pulmonarius]
MDGPQLAPNLSAFHFPNDGVELALWSLAAALIVLVVFVLTNRRGRSTRGNALLLVGCQDAGKTAILSTLVYKQTLPTHASLQTNQSIVSLSPQGKSIRALDVPGHPRVRDQYKDFLPDAGAIAFVIDASTISRNGATVAEHLHNVLHALTSLPPSQTPPALLIVAHKTDLLQGSSTASSPPGTFAIARVKTILERELEKRRSSQSNGVGIENLGEDGETSEIGGLECVGNGPFRFDDWEGGDVSFIATSCKVTKRNETAEKTLDEKEGLTPLLQWLEDTF